MHYFTKVGSGEIPIDEEEWEDLEETEEVFMGVTSNMPLENNYSSGITRRTNSLVCPKFNVSKTDIIVKKIEMIYSKSLKLIFCILFQI